MPEYSMAGHETKNTSRGAVQYYDGMEAVQPSQEPELVPVENQYVLAGSLPERAIREDAVERWLQVDERNEYELPGFNTDPKGDVESSPSQKKDTKIIDIKNPRFWVKAGVIAVIIIAAIVGAVVGSLSRTGGTSTISTQNGTDGIRTLAQSKLAASGWTDSSGAYHKIVYFQDEQSHLIARYFDSSIMAWSTINITADANSDDLQKPLLPRGTSLTSVAAEIDGNYANYVFYQDEASFIRKVGTTDSTASPGSWTFSTLADQGSMRAARNTQMGATFQGCKDGDGITTLECPGFFLLTFINSENGISMANGTSSSTFPSAWSSTPMHKPDEVAINSVVAMAPRRYGRPNSINYMFQTTDDQMAHNGNSGRADQWFNVSNQMELEPAYLSENNSQPAVMKLQSDKSEIFIALQSQQRVKACIWNQNGSVDSNRDCVQQVEFVDYNGALLAFSAIATTSDGWFYGISDGKVLEFQYQEDFDWTFYFRGIVY